ncbi:uncharacterized protein [Typha latifolia]|uniref:uncharacterized protein n=1 Tax=Typha latifolia TaxID=4733 RepID=UPI003C2D7FA1
MGVQVAGSCLQWLPIATATAHASSSSSSSSSTSCAFFLPLSCKRRGFLRSCQIEPRRRRGRGRSKEQTLRRRAFSAHLRSEDDDDESEVELVTSFYKLALGSQEICEEGLQCPVKKAFSSMVFIIRELHSYTLQMRQLLFSYEDLQGILARVQLEMQDSFVWLFQRIFSCTPTLMVSVMLLLANFTVYSMSHNVAAAAPPPPPAGYAVEVVEIRHERKERFDLPAVMSFSVIGGGDGVGNVRPAAGPTDDWRSDRIRTMRLAAEDEVRVWNKVVEEASRMEASGVDPETRKGLVAPVVAQLAAEDYADYLRTELKYQAAVSEDPGNPLLLSNFAQFLYLVVHDLDRAEYYFKRAVRIQPADAESLSRYATFLWMAKKDFEAAEEIYLEAIAADPSNSYHAANYAHFLWNTGAEDTCFPLDA